ncbi:hypothetical protein BCR34DRAFT_277532 [Clohesyomyces aquaticus]|uniref:F-box domain-containing protein n=1 Tax=Clohesyomyces aquaticus TaxID=1231657 RepID=A0A1Y1ZS44_9PLEO|nr:hypothetical protein BCR34DRAFT_277532 [Clohesyomyces aquaticus]
MSIPILRLPEELRRAVLSYCNSSTVLSLCLACRAFNDVFVDSIYHTIDLSVHNEDTWGRHSEYINVHLPADHVKRTRTHRDVAILLRQSKLISLLQKHPELGSKTRVLRWTLMDDAGDSRWSRIPFAEFNDGTETLWQTFRCFSNVTEIDLAFMTQYREQTAPPPLFATATTVSLTGIVSHAVLSSILSSIAPARLHHLRLNNVQTFADPDTILDALSPNEVDLHRRTRTGLLYGYLKVLTSCCPTLQTLYISTAGQFLDNSRTFRNTPSPAGQQELDDGANEYAEIGSFLESVKGTLKEFVFEHGPDMEYFHVSPTSSNLLPQLGLSLTAPLPMDVFFDSNILPVLSSRPWPKLRRIVVRGVGQWLPVDPWQENSGSEEVAYLHRKIKEFRNRAELIWDAVDIDRVEVVVEDEASRPFYGLRADKRRNLTGIR